MSDPDIDVIQIVIPGPPGPASPGIAGGGITMRLRPDLSAVTLPTVLSAGQVRFDNTLQNGAGKLWISEADVASASIEGNHNAIDAVNNPRKAVLRLVAVADSNRWIEYIVTDVIDKAPANFFEYVVSTIGSSGGASPLVDGEAIIGAASPYGDSGASTAEAADSAAAAAASAAAAAASAAAATTNAQTVIDDNIDAISASVAQAAMWALEASDAIDRFTAHSTTPVAIAVGDLSFTIEPDKDFVPGDYKEAMSNANPLVDYVVGQVLSYVGTTLVLRVLSGGTNGGGTHSDWTIRPSGTRGPQGSTIPQGSTTSATSKTSALGSQTFTVPAGLNFPLTQVVLVQSAGQPGTWMLGPITAYSGTSMTINVTDIGPTAGTRADWNINWSSVRGPAGADGTPGGIGVTGKDAGIRWKFSTSTGDPGTQHFGFDNTTFLGASKVRFSENDLDNNNVAAILDHLDDSTNVPKALCIMIKKGGTGYFAFLIQSNITDLGLYDEFNITPIGASGSVNAEDEYSLNFGLFGNIGPTGATGPGSGDMLKSLNLSDVLDKRASKDNISVHGTNITAAATINLESATGDLVVVTGNTNISGIILGDGHERTVIFTGTPTLMFNVAGNPIFPIGGADLPIVAGDTAIFRGTGSGVNMVAFSRPAGATFIQAVSGTAFIVGPNGFTNPSFVVNTAAASAVTGWNISATAAGTPIVLGVISSATNEGGIINAKGTGTLTLQDSATGNLVTGQTFRPKTNDGAALGVSGTAFADLFLANGAVVNFNAGNYTITHSTGKLTFAGGTISYPGTGTNDNAATGEVGEYFEDTVAFGSAITLTSNTAANLVSRTLPAGDYDVSFMAVYAPDSGVSVTARATGCSTTSATFDSSPIRSVPGVLATVTTAGQHDGVTLPRLRFSLATSTTVYGIVRMTFTGGAVKAYGGWSIRRKR